MRRIRTKKILMAATVSGVMALTAGLVACNKKNADTLLSDAKQYEAKGDYKAAVIQLKNSLEQNPDNAEVRYLLGTTYLETGDPQSAEKEIRKAISLGMPKDKAVASLGKALLLQGQFHQVIDETQTPGATNDAETLVLRGNAFMALSKNAEAKESYEAALRASPDLLGALIGLARFAVQEKDMDGAIRLSEQAVAKNPKSMEAWLFKGDLLREQGKVDLALDAYTDTLKLKPDNAAVHISKATLEISAKKYDDAKLDVDAAKKVAPNNVLVFYTQALLDFTQGRNAEALESVQQALKRAPEHMPSLLLAGAVQFSLGATEQAEQYLKKYLDKYPDNLYARKLLASTLLKNKQRQRAIDILAPVLKDGQQDAQVYMIAGEAYMQAKDFAKAGEYFEKANALDPEASGGHTALGMSKLGQGETAAAAAELEKATSMSGKSPQTGVLLVMAHLRQKEYDKALTAVNALEKEQPDNPLVQNLKGGIYLAKKDIAKARASFEKAIALQPTYLPAVQNLAQLDMVAKKPDMAKQRFEAVLEKDKKNAQAMVALGKLAESQGKNDEATNWFERAETEAPNVLQPGKQLVAHYLHIGDKQKALATAKKLQGANPTIAEFNELLAQTDIALGDKQGALESYGKIAVLLPESAAIQYRIASIHLAMQDEPAATEALKKTLRLDPNFIDAQISLAELQAKKGNYDDALAVARQLQQQKQKTKALVGYVLEGDVLTAKKDFASAVKAYEQAASINKSGPLEIKLHKALTDGGKSKDADARIAQWIKEHPADTSVRLYFGEVCLANKQNKAAIAQFEAALQTQPQNAAALNNLAWVYYQEKDPRALPTAEKAFKVAGDSAAVMDTLGWLLVEQGNVGRGLPLLQKASSLAPASSDLRYHVAIALMKSGDKVNARKELEQLVAGKAFSKMDEAKALLKQL